MVCEAACYRHEGEQEGEVVQNESEHRQSRGCVTLPLNVHPTTTPIVTCTLHFSYRRHALKLSSPPQ